MDNHYNIRLVTETDVNGILEIYKPYVINTAITFEYEVPSPDEYLQRIKTNTTEYPWLVCLQDGKIVGYTYAGKHRYRKAYQWSPESTIYLDSEIHGRGIARILYETLFSILRLQGYFNVYAAAILENDRSVFFHRALGFEEIGIFKKVGYKLGNWHDTAWFQLTLAAHTDNPTNPKKINDVTETAAFKSILKGANKRLNDLD
jgi:L-amino acid N-acyltransferase YncA